MRLFKQAKQFFVGLSISLYYLLAPVCYSLDAINLQLQNLSVGQVQLQGIRLTLSEVSAAEQFFSLSATQLKLPAPLDTLQFLEVRCQRLRWQTSELRCQQGGVTLKLSGKRYQAQQFTFALNAKSSQLQLKEIPLAKGKLSLTIKADNDAWAAELQAQHLQLTELQKWLTQAGFTTKNGAVSAQITLNGKNRQAHTLQAKLTLHTVTAESKSGKWATEELGGEVYLNAQAQGANWVWQQHANLQQGALYIDPIYVSIPKQALDIDSIGLWHTTENRWQIDYLQILHPLIANAHAYGVIQPSADPWLPAATINLDTQHLKSFYAIYLEPFWVGSSFAGLTFDGSLQTKFALENYGLTALQAQFNNLNLEDSKQRFGLRSANGNIDWSAATAATKIGQLNWRQLSVYALPLGSAQLNFRTAADQVALTQAVTIDFLGGHFGIDSFKWQSRKGRAPEILFAGALKDVSLDQLTRALKWTPLSGKVSGTIPGVRYHKNRLDLEGAIGIQVFGGQVTLENLAVANLMSAVPKFYSDIAITRLDLKQITDTFKFGGIEGSLSGFINDLYLENWQPVSFYTWLGTPEDDDNAHRISQKAVDNIANIGGNGATDLVSRGVLSLFDSFGYDELGIGCYLYKGVCQLMGVAAADNGYYLVKGGGLPRIDVIGYNPRVDWKVLVQRLNRLNSTDNMVVE